MLQANADSGVMYFEVGSLKAGNEAAIEEVRNLVKDKAMLGLAIAEGIPKRPEGPSLACNIRLVQNATGATEAIVLVWTTSANGLEWVEAGKFTLPLERDDKGQISTEKLLDAVAEGTLSRLVRVQLIKEKGKDKQGNAIYRIKIENASPLVLNGLSLAGMNPTADQKPSALAGISLPPRKNLSVRPPRPWSKGSA